MMRTLWLAAVLALVGDRAYAQRELDTSFGDGGYVTLGFQPVAGQNYDSGLAACPGPDGTLVVAGIASEDQRVVTAWLTPTGALDVRFSQDGKESFDLPPTTAMYARHGLCHPSGRIYLVNESADAADDGRIVVVAIDPATGLPPAGFGNGGFATLDLDAYGSGLARFEEPSQLAPGPANGVLIAGYYELAGGGESGFVATISATGTVENVHLSHLSPRPVGGYRTAAVAGDGSIWAVARDKVEALSVVRLRPDDLSYVDTVQTIVGDFDALASRMIDGSSMLVAASRSDAVPVALSVTPARTSMIEVPDVPVGALVRAAIVPVSGTRFVVAWGSQLASETDWPFAFARLDVASTGRIAFDRTFGTGGHETYAPKPTPCASRAFLARMTVWNGHPTLVGRVNPTCALGSDTDYLVMRLSNAYLFGGGFE